MKTAKKLLSLLLCMCMVMTCMGFGSAYAEEGDHTHTYDLEQEPAWNWADDFSSATAKFACTGCGETADVTDDAPVETPVSDATCTAEKVASFEATVEFEEKTFTDTQEEVSVPGTMLPHSFTNYVPNNDATCTKDGTKTAKCDNCEETDTITDEGSMLPHSFTNYVPNNDATCTKDGTKTAKCDNCDATDTITDEGSMLPHDYVTTIVEPTCTEKGYTEHKCSNCDDVYYTDFVDSIGHNFDETDESKVSIKEASCLEDGLKTVTCQNCDATQETVLPKLGHSYDVETTNPTCTQAGETTFTCSRCGFKNDELTKTINALGHSYDATTVPATCTKAGETTYTCSRCGTKNEEMTEVLSALGHSYDAATVAATCTKAGETTYTCSRCGFKNEEMTEVLSALGHSYDATTVPATCTKAGETTYTCSRCGFKNEEMTEVIPALGHSYDAMTTDPTCTEGGYTVYTCKNCTEGTDGHTYTANEIDALGHSFDETVAGNVNIDNPTCTESGLKTVKCIRCDVTTETPLSALGHDFDESIEENVTDAQNGMILVKCARDNCTATAMRVKASSEFHYYELVEKGQYSRQSKLYEDGVISKPDGYPEDQDDEAKTEWEVKFGQCGTKCLNKDADGTPHNDYNFDKHDFDYTIIEEATCTDNAKWIGRCQNCGYEVTLENAQTFDISSEHPLKEHTFDAWVSVDDETHCSKCTNGNPNCTAEKTVPHNYGEWVYQNDSTLFKDGTEIKTCADCGHTVSQPSENTSKIVVFVRWLAGLLTFKSSIVYFTAKWIVDLLDPNKPFK